MDLRITGGRALIDGDLVDTAIDVADGHIAGIGADGSAAKAFDATDLMVLPGIVDMHGDAFERQMMPRPGVDVALDIALIDTDRQVIANGITTVFHGVTWSWEPGLRGSGNARSLLAAIEALRPRLAADTRFHLRHETFNLDAEPEVSNWLAARRIDALAFNDHLPSETSLAKWPDKIAQMAERARLDREAFMALVSRLRGRSGEVPGSMERLAARANASGVPLISHDDSSPEARRWFRALGCRVCEFPINIETARDAAAAGDHIVLGAPNVMRGGSHLGWVNAAEMVSRELCSVLASDYYYPAPLLAAFRLCDTGVVPLGKAWDLVSGEPARALGLTDRGRIEAGLRADLIAIDPTVPGRPRIVAVVVAGRIVYLADAGRLSN